MFFELLGKLRIDHDVDIKAGIRSYSGQVSAEKGRLSAAEYTKMLTACNDDGAIICRHEPSRATVSRSGESIRR